MQNHAKYPQGANCTTIKVGIAFIELAQFLHAGGIEETFKCNTNGNQSRHVRMG
jgi:hypothetical protein